MDKTRTLEELLEIKDLSDYGLKTEGLVEIKKFFDTFNPREIDIRYPINVIDFFAMPVGEDLASQQLKEKYFEFTKDFSAPRIMLARSSDPEEMPGKFETHSSLFDPANREESFQNWLRAARRVRDSGARALIGQPLVGELEDFDYNYGYDSKGKKFYQHTKSFGSGNSSFVGRSTGLIRGNFPSLVACWGLATKLVRGDRDVSLIQAGPHRIDITNLTHNYGWASFAQYIPDTIDVISLDEPDKITSLKYCESLSQYRGRVINNNVAPFEDYLFQDRDNDYWGFHPYDLLELITAIKNKIGQPVEVEGCVNGAGVNLWQLRKYELPKKHFQGLSDVPAEK